MTCETQTHTCYVSECPPGTEFLESLCFDNKICCIGVKACSPDSCINGTCIINTCTCHPGFSGANCNVDACASNGFCQNGGVCQREATGAKYSCSCAPGYEGLNCDIDACASNGLCQNEGVCQREATGAKYSCSCAPGYEGLNCDIDACASNGLCQNGGVCQREATGAKYSCSCAPGYDGLNCDIDACVESSGACVNGGSCNRQLAEPYYNCSCPTGFTGVNCELSDSVPPCGMPVTSRIFSGSADIASQNPWLVKVVHAGFVYCSGVIIDREWIALDAFCVVICGGLCYVVIGDYDGATVEAQEQVRSLTSYTIHPQANFQDLASFGTVTGADPDAGLAYNVAIARFSAPITFSDGINRVCPPSDAYNVLRAPRNCVIAGYGKQDTTESVHLSTTSIRQVIDTLLIDDSLCTMIRGRSVQPAATHCAFLTTPNSGLCIGDNGGALVCQNDTLGFWTVEGILSYLPDGSNGACSGQINVFTDMTAVWSWMQTVIAAGV
ncbi:delta-like protein D isoform X1 [Haliotis cracherodii]|uniref:delta-like protein D isoform X1 n=1 Tax=Haliotis cracherodii TaxID=6455 RepID=UPI0039EBD031